jgi:TolA-binding protein
LGFFIAPLYCHCAAIVLPSPAIGRQFSLAAIVVAAIPYRPQFSFDFACRGRTMRCRDAIVLFLVALLAVLPARRLRADAGDDQYAVAAGHYSAQRWSLAVDEFRALLRNHPEHRNATKSRFFIAEALVQLGRYDEAQHEFRDFLARDPDSPLAPQALFRAGESAFLAGRADAARPLLRDFHAKYPAEKLNAYVLNYLGQLALADGDATAAAQFFKQSLEHFPAEPPSDECRYGLARANELAGKSSDAAALYRQLCNCPDASLAEQSLLRLALVQANSGDTDRAIATFESFEQRYPKSADLIQAKLEHARTLYKHGHFDRAEAILEPLAAAGRSGSNAALNQSQQSAAQYLLALAYQGSKRPTDALKLLDAMQESADEQWKPKIELAQAASLIATQQYAAAAASLETFLQSRPTDERAPRAVAQLAICYAKTKQWAAARKAYGRLSHGARRTLAFDDKPTG